MLKEKRCLSILLMVLKFLLILTETILMKKILLKKFWFRKSWWKELKNTHIVKLIFKARKKTYFYNFFCLYKNVNSILSKQLRKVFKKGSGTVPKLFWRRKNKNLEYGHERYKTFLKDKKQRLVEYANNLSLM